MERYEHRAVFMSGLPRNGYFVEGRMTPEDVRYLEALSRLRLELIKELEMEVDEIDWAISKIRALEKENAELRAEIEVDNHPVIVL